MVPPVFPVTSQVVQDKDGKDKYKEKKQRQFSKVSLHVGHDFVQR